MTDLRDALRRASGVDSTDTVDQAEVRERTRRLINRRRTLYGATSGLAILFIAFAGWQVADCSIFCRTEMSSFDDRTVSLRIEPENPRPGERVRLTIENAGDQALSYDMEEGFALERLVEGAWQGVETASIITPVATQTLSPGDSASQPLAHSLEPGDYRLTQTVSLDEERSEIGEVTLLFSVAKAPAVIRIEPTAPVEGDTVRFRIVNVGDELLGFNYGYRLERWSNGEWTSMRTMGVDIAMVRSLAPGRRSGPQKVETTTGGIRKPRFHALEPGTYRITETVSKGEKHIPIRATFRVEPAHEAELVTTLHLTPRNPEVGDEIVFELENRTASTIEVAPSWDLLLPSGEGISVAAKCCAVEIAPGERARVGPRRAFEAAGMYTLSLNVTMEGEAEVVSHTFKVAKGAPAILHIEPEEPRSSDELELLIENVGETRIYYGLCYRLERRVLDDRWKSIGHKGCRLPLLSVAPGNTKIAHPIVSKRSDTLQPGTYRIIKRVGPTPRAQSDIRLSKTFTVR